MGDKTLNNDAEDPRRADEEEDEKSVVIMEEYYDEGPDYRKLVKQYTLTYSALFIGLVLYACIGGAVFMALESPNEYQVYKDEHRKYMDRRNAFINQMWNVTTSYGDDEAVWRSKALMVIQRHDIAAEQLVRPPYRRKEKWSFTRALFFSCTVISTIGCSNIAPVTTGGRIFCMVYAVFGIAMFLLILASFGTLFARGATITYRLIIQMAKGAPPPKKTKKLRMVRVPAPEPGQNADGQGVPLQDKRPDMDDVIRDIWSTEPEIPQGDMTPMRVMTLKEPQGDDGGPSQNKPGTSSDEQNPDVETEEQVDIPLTIVLVFALLYVCLLALLLSIWELQWNYFEAFYFSFITLTTIGLGDVIPVHQKNLLGCTFYILLGMVILSMCIALAQKIIMKKVAWISEKVGVALIKAKPT